tara:strand:+ start:1258 stop:1632 length:375 start_codon:yes stop_codon:yes gene_type:complete
MKKLLFVLAFAFIGGQAFSQMYIVSLLNPSIHNCNSNSSLGPTELTLCTISPTGVITMSCIQNGYGGGDITAGLASVNQELNSIMGQGYKLINVDYGEYGSQSYNGISNGDALLSGTTFYLAIP